MRGENRRPAGLFDLDARTKATPAGRNDARRQRALIDEHQRLWGDWCYGPHGNGLRHHTDSFVVIRRDRVVCSDCAPTYPGGEAA